MSTIVKLLTWFQKTHGPHAVIMMKLWPHPCHDDYGTPCLSHYMASLSCLNMAVNLSKK